MISDLSIIQSQEFNEQLDSKVKNIKDASSIEISKFVNQLKYNISREPSLSNDSIFTLMLAP